MSSLKAEARQSPMDKAPHQHVNSGYILVSFLNGIVAGVVLFYCFTNSYFSSSFSSKASSRHYRDSQLNESYPRAPDLETPCQHCYRSPAPCTINTDKHAHSDTSRSSSAVSSVDETSDFEEVPSFQKTLVVKDDDIEVEEELEEKSFHEAESQFLSKPTIAKWGEWIHKTFRG